MKVKPHVNGHPRKQETDEVLEVIVENFYTFFLAKKLPGFTNHKKLYDDICVRLRNEGILKTTRNGEIEFTPEDVRVKAKNNKKVLIKRCNEKSK